MRRINGGKNRKTMQVQTDGTDEITAALQQINAHLDALSMQFVARRALLELIVLGLITREHVLLIGPPGTGKSAVVQAIAKTIDATAFEYLIGRFTEPSELFGALDLNALKDGQIKPVTNGMLPEAEVAFLDEIFLGSTAILNSLLKILNERTYRRGQYSVTTPLISCVAASNAMPEDSQLAAFADRFLVTMYVDPVGEHELPELLATGWRQSMGSAAPVAPIDKSLISKLHDAMLAIDMDLIHDAYAHMVRKLRLVGIALSDRKIVKGQKLIAAAALLRGGKAAGPEDMWPITYLIQSKAQQEQVRELLHVELKHSQNPVLSKSVAKATYGPTAHAAALTEQATSLLDGRPAQTGDPLYEIWLVRLETMLTRIDAAFNNQTLPQPLGVLRASIETILASAAVSNENGDRGIAVSRTMDAVDGPG